MIKRKDKGFHNSLRYILYLIVVLLLNMNNLIAAPSVSGSTKYDNMLLGNPSDAEQFSSNYLIEYDAYSVAYNFNEKIPVWVQWHLCPADIGKFGRSNEWSQESRNGMPSASPGAYKRDFDFDRGHLCPSSDRTRNVRLNRETFKTTNIVPQNSMNNEKPWKKFEEDLRNLVKGTNRFEIYIVAGTAGKGGSGSTRNEKYNYIERTYEKNDRQQYEKIMVPEFLWKSAIIIRNMDGSDINRINADSLIVSIMVPNSGMNLKSDWKSYVCSVNDIEHKTGLTLFPNLSASNDVYELKSRIFSDISLQFAANKIP